MAMGKAVDCALGHLEAGTRRGPDVHFVGFNWVGLAVGMDDAMLVTILHEVEDRAGLDEDVRHVAEAADLYTAALEHLPAGCRVHFNLHGSMDVVIACRAVTQGTRYHTLAELEGFGLGPDGGVYRGSIAARRHLIATDPFAYQVSRPLTF